VSSPARLAAAGMTTSTVVALTAGLSMLQPLSTDLYLPTLPAIASHFDAGVAAVQWTLSAFIAVFGVWQLVAGPLTDRYGRYPLIALGATGLRAGQRRSACWRPRWPCSSRARALQGLRRVHLPRRRARLRARPLHAERRRANDRGRRDDHELRAAARADHRRAAREQLRLARGLRGARRLLRRTRLFARVRLKETNTRRNPHASHRGRCCTRTARCCAHRRSAPTPSPRPQPMAACSRSSPGRRSVLDAKRSGSPPPPTRSRSARWWPATSSARSPAAGCCRAGVAADHRGGRAAAGRRGRGNGAFALAGVHAPLAITVPMFFYGLSHGLVHSRRRNRARSRHSRTTRERRRRCSAS